MSLRDPHFVRLYRELEESKVVAARARGPSAVEARGRQNQAKSAIDDYLAAAKQLSAQENQHALHCGLSAHDMLAARLRLPSDYYARAIAGTGSMSVRDCLMLLAQRGMLDKEEPVPADIADEVAVVSDVQKAIEDIAKVRDGKFAAGMISALQNAAKALAKAHGEDPAAVIPIVDAVREAIAKKDLAAVRRAIEGVAEHFGLGINAPAPPAVESAREGRRKGTTIVKATSSTLSRSSWMTGKAAHVGSVRRC
jgi:hypothetical protein